MSYKIKIVYESMCYKIKINTKVLLGTIVKLIQNLLYKLK